MFFVIFTIDYTSENTLRSLYEAHHKVLLNYAYSILKSQSMAEDAVHDVFVKLISHLHKFQDVNSPQTKRYLIVATRNICYDMLRLPLNDELNPDFADDMNDPVWEQIQIREVINDISGLINEMRDIDKGILISRFVWQYSCSEIADLYNTTENYITSRISRLRKAIKKGLRPKWGNTL